jgi:hypothetical protein
MFGRSVGRSVGRFGVLAYIGIKIFLSGNSLKRIKLGQVEVVRFGGNHFTVRPSMQYCTGSIISTSSFFLSILTLSALYVDR